RSTRVRWGASAAPQIPTASVSIRWATASTRRKSTRSRGSCPERSGAIRAIDSSISIWRQAAPPRARRRSISLPPPRPANMLGDWAAPSYLLVFPGLATGREGSGSGEEKLPFAFSASGLGGSGGIGFYRGEDIVSWRAFLRKAGLSASNERWDF